MSTWHRARIWGACRYSGGVLLAALAALVLIICVPAFLPAISSGHGPTALVSLVVVAVLALGVVLCVYMISIWTLAAVVHIWGPAGAIGRRALIALWIISPQLARRTSRALGVATASTSLLIAPPMAAAPSAPSSSASTHEPTPAVSTPAVSMLWESTTDSTAPVDSTTTGDPAFRNPGLFPIEDHAHGNDDHGEELAVGFASSVTDGSSSAPSATAAAEPSPRPSIPARSPLPLSGIEDEDEPSSPERVRTRPGDSLWSITDDLLGPDPDDPAEIERLWPRLYAANAQVIGPNPDVLAEGIDLDPSPVTSAAHSTSKEQP